MDKMTVELRPAVVAYRLSQILGQHVGIAPDCIGPEVEKSVASLTSGDALLLENLRFHSDERTQGTVSENHPSLLNLEKSLLC